MLMIKTGGKRDEHALFRLDHSIESSEIELPSLVIVIEVGFVELGIAGYLGV
jgi:hypothetical protein